MCGKSTRNTGTVCRVPSKARGGTLFQWIIRDFVISDGLGKPFLGWAPPQKLEADGNTLQLPLGVPVQSRKRYPCADDAGYTQRSPPDLGRGGATERDRKSTRLNSSHVAISYAVCCLKNKTRT